MKRFSPQLEDLESRTALTGDGIPDPPNPVVEPSPVYPSAYLDLLLETVGLRNPTTSLVPQPTTTTVVPLLTPEVEAFWLNRNTFFP